MKAATFLASPTGTVLVVGVLGVVVLSVAAYSAKNVAQVAVSAVNPANNDNIFASGVDSIGRSLSGNDKWRLGFWLDDVINGTSEERTSRQQEQDLINRIGG